MKRVFLLIVLTLSLFLALVSNTLAGELEAKLIDAAKSGDTGTVRALLDKGVDVNTTDTYGVPVLGCAASDRERRRS